MRKIVVLLVLTFATCASLWWHLPEEVEIDPTEPSGEQGIRFEFEPKVIDRNGLPLSERPSGSAGLAGPRMRPVGAAWARLKELPDCAAPMIKTIEGWSSLGVRHRSLPRAWVEGRGGSSIDMQNASNFFGAKVPERVLREAIGDADNWIGRQLARQRYLGMQAYRKVLEMGVAYRTAYHFKPSDRLEWYFNTASFASARPGIEYAAERLLGKSASELTCHELLGLITTLTRPVPSGPEAVARYRASARYHAGYINRLNLLVEREIVPDYKREVWADPPEIKWHSINRPSWSAAAVERAVQEARQILAGLDGHRIGDGLRIQTSLDSRIQDRVGEVVKSHLMPWPEARSSVVMADPNGMAKVYHVSSALLSGDLDHVRASVQPGSRLKVPIYAMALAFLREQGLSTQEIMSYELPTRYERSSGDIIENCSRFGDTVPLSAAFKHSCNAPVWWIVNELYDPQSVSQWLAHMGAAPDVGPHQAMGMGNWDMSEEQIILIYNALLNTYEAPQVGLRLVERIMTRDGTVIYDAYDDSTSQWAISRDAPVIAPEVGQLLRELMRRAVEDGTARRLCEGHDRCMTNDPAVKTGTNSGSRYKHRGVTGRFGSGNGFILSVTIQGEGGIPVASRSAVPLAANVLAKIENVGR